MASKLVELTAKQQSNALSSKKKKTKKTYRYALAQTLPRYWPQLTKEQSKMFQDIMRNASVANPQWFTEKKCNSDDRPIYYGLQASIRKLRTGQIRCLILSADLKPRYVANQIIVQALAGNEAIRILCVPNLNDILQPILHFSCYAFVINSWASFPQLDEWTSNVINENYPVPEIIRTHFTHRQKICSMEVYAQQVKRQMCNKHTAENVDIKYLHLPRTNCESKERAFVPRNGINLKPIALEIESLNKINSDYISIDSGPSQTTGFHKKSKKLFKAPLAMYRDLTIHKIQNNPSKAKKKQKSKK